jgi:apolipoprotein N-acyltransferase
MLEKTKPSIHPLLLSVISGVLLWLCWPTSPLTLLVFAGWVPLFWLEAQSKNLLRFWGLVYLAMLIWNGATTWWVSNTTVPVSGILAAVLNALLMTVPWIGFWKTKRRFGSLIGYTALIAYWLTFEYVHLNWELSWPWLTLGNVFAGRPGWVQWYEWTGTTGGGLWIWVVNICLFETLRRAASRQMAGGVIGSPADTAGPPGLRSVKTWTPLALLLVVPLLVSLAIGWCRNGLSLVPASGPDIVVVQPNIDPYDEKFTAGTEDQQLLKLISLSESRIDSTTAFVVWPETAIPFDIDEARFGQTRALEPMRLFLQRHPRVQLITGLSGSAILPPGTTTAAMRLDSATGRYFEDYNSAVQTDASGTTDFYHKGKLVPGAEIIPYTWLFGFLEKLSLDFGGTSGTLGRGAVRSVFTNPQNGFKIGPIICYESIYGAYVTGYVRNGANMLAIITNDGWWGDTQGYRQHQQYARLRAIENRRWIARSANTGISCFIDPLGKVYQPQPWDTASAIKMIIPAVNTLTLYSRWGDWISVLALAWAVLILCMGIYSRLAENK